jgi:hypothetical protein
MRRISIVTAIVACSTIGAVGMQDDIYERPRGLSAKPFIDWSNEVRRAIVPAGRDNVFGEENYGNKFPGEAAIYMGIVHAAMYDAVVAIEGRYQPYAMSVTAPPDTSAEAAVATAAHHTLIGLQPALGLSDTQERFFTDRYNRYMERILDGQAKENGLAIGAQAAESVLALRENDGREKNPTREDLDPPPPGPGVWDEGTSPAVGVRLPGILPLALEGASQFRPDGPNPLTSVEYAKDVQEVAELGRADGDSRSKKQTTQALFWTDHDIRQWNDGLLRLAGHRGLDLVRTARLLAMAHVAGGDAMIACFDAKYKYWFWRPYQAIPGAEQDRNPMTAADSTWQPLGVTPNFPEYPSAHACHSSAMATVLEHVFGDDRIPFTLDSRITRITRRYARFHDVITDVNTARVLIGFHFRNSDEEGAALGRNVARYVTSHRFLPRR